MFKSYEQDPDKECYKIIDDDFTVNVHYYDCNIEPGHGRLLAYCIIKEYEKRLLNVPANLALAFCDYINQNLKEGYRKVSIEQIIEGNDLGNPYYSKYADDVEKYLLLI